MPEDRKHWIKVWTEEWLTGTVREELSPVERSIWIDLIVMAGRSRTLGIVQANETTGYSHKWLSQIMGVHLEDFEIAIKHFNEQGRISENGQGIKIINWPKYQSEKARIRPYIPEKEDK